jgi:hypothetical protein
LVDLGEPTKFGFGFDPCPLAQEIECDFRYNHRLIANDGVVGIVTFVKEGRRTS